MTTMVELERRLRLPAPDEPSVLPPLLLPTDTASVGRAGIRWRPPILQASPARLVLVVVLVMLLAAFVAVGAMLQRDRTLTPLGLACQPDQGPVFGVNCPSLAIPDGWATLAEGQIMPGEFTEVGLGYEIVQLMIASAPLGACPTTPGPFPQAVPSGGSVDVPVPTPDAGLQCLRDSQLPANAVRVETLRGTRVLGQDEAGLGIPDTSEPTPEAGWTETVAGRPARLTVAAGAATDGEPAETRTWDILVPGSIDEIIRIRADIAGPDIAAGRATVQSIIDSVEFATTPPPLADTNPNETLRAVLDYLDRTTRPSHSDFYGCFPRDSGSVAGTISGDPTGPLGGSLDVTCSSSVTASAAGVWRIVLEVSWEATDEYEGDSIRTELFATGVTREGGFPEYSGGYMTALSGRPMAPIGPMAWFPTGQTQLPEPQAGPLNLPPGSLVEMLPPGEQPGPEPGMVDDSIYAGIVGTHLYVVDGPEVIDGEEWYRVQGGTTEFGWVRGTRDGRPQLALAALECPAGDISVGDVTWLIPYERLACFADAQLTFENAVLQRSEQGEVMCSDESGNVLPCSGGHPDWLTTFSVWNLYGPGGPTGPDPPLEVWLHPSVAGTTAGTGLRIVGQFDHPEAAGCTWPGDGSAGLVLEDEVEAVLLCRERFVITDAGA